MADKPRKPSWSTPLLIGSFALVFLVMFNPALRDATGEAVGVVLTPLIGFNGQYPIITIFLASVILVIGTTTIRHFLVDWTGMARTQEAMRSFQKEFSEARKSNNTYKVKKLTEAQPKVFELQAALQKDQLRPMAFTMLLVIPLFAWLGHYLVQPVDFEVTDAPLDEYIVFGKNQERVLTAFVASADHVGETVFTGTKDLYGYAVAPPGSTATADSKPVYVASHTTGAEFLVHTTNAPVVPETARVADLEAGSYSLLLDPPTDGAKMTLTGNYAPYDVDTAVAFVMQDGEAVRAVAVDTKGVTLTLDAPGALYVIIPEGLGGDATGEATLRVIGETTEEITLAAGNVVSLDPATHAAPIYPHSAKLPWQDPWSLQDFWWFLPNWILLYSLFGIPFGQIAQRALKLWEYRHVDLDDDGKQAGDSA